MVIKVTLSWPGISFHFSRQDAVFFIIGDNHFIKLASFLEYEIIILQHHIIETQFELKLNAETLLLCG